MKIRALRVAEVGPFSSAVAVEDLSGGLDVLTGPNEAGKSTLFAALALLIGEKHTSAAREVAALRPDSGGAPLVEADLEIEGRLWRVRKRFLAQRTAELREIGGGALWRGADAEEQLKALLGARGAMRGFVWVPQQKSFDLPDQRADRSVAALAADLSQLIEQEAADAAGAGLPRRLAAVIGARLGELVTLAHGKAKAGGVLDQAQRRRGDLVAQLDIARQKGEQAAARLERLSVLRDAQRTAAAQDTRQVLAARLEAARRAITAADQARERSRTAAEKVSGRRLALDGARAALEALDRRVAELERARTAAADTVVKLEALRREREQRAAQVRELRTALAAADREKSEAHRLVALLDRQDLRQSAVIELAEIDRRLADAGIAAAELAAAEQALAANHVRPELVGQMRRLSSQVALLEAKVAHVAPTFAFVREHGALARVLIDGVPLEDGRKIAIEKPARIVIEGIGSFTIEPPNGVSDVEARDASRAELGRLLGQLGVSNLAEAEGRLAERTTSERVMEVSRARLAAYAPHGLPALAEQRSAVLARTAGEAVPDLPDRAALKLRTEQAEALSVLKKDALDREQAAIAAASEGIARLEALLGSARQRESELSAQLPHEDARAAARQELADTERDRSEAYAEAVRERAAWAEATPDGPAYEALLASFAAAEAAIAAHDQLCDAREREISTLEGALRRDGEEGAGAEIAGLAEELAVAEERVADLELEVRALELLRDRVGKVGSSHREQMLRPVVERLQPLLDSLMPGARLLLEGPLLVARLERGERADAMARLSGGTREQIATLVRIAYAGLMADRGQELPLVLDDALVFSDDERLARMIGILAGAAQRHQVILLSCRSRALEPVLEAHCARRLEIVPWVDVDVASSAIATRRGRSGSPAS
jgi:hypothetical protein